MDWLEGACWDAVRRGKPRYDLAWQAPGNGCASQEMFRRDEMGHGLVCTAARYVEVRYARDWPGEVGRDEARHGMHRGSLWCGSLSRGLPRFGKVGTVAGIDAEG